MGGLRSAGGGGPASVRPLLHAQGPARPWRKVGRPASARSATLVIVGSFAGVSKIVAIFCILQKKMYICIVTFTMDNHLNVSQ